ncbi:MAG: hypothetical protein WA814_10180 [Candidatus Baltobacteraceae bacterium]
MEPIDASQARSHIEMIDRILAETHQRLCAGGEYFVVWGFGSAFVTVIFQLVDRRVVMPSALWLVPIVLAACAAFSILRSRRTQRVLARSSIVQREFFNVLWLTLGMAFVVNVAVYRIFWGLASAAIWSVAEAIVLLYIGMHGNRRAQIAGVLVVVSLIAANFAPPAIAGYVLAAGMLAGYGGFGVSELLARD